MNVTFTCKYNIGEYVYHATPESDKGLIIDIHYSAIKGVKYEVVFGRLGNDNVYCYEHELSKEKSF